jgi:hypothetical protein
MQGSLLERGVGWYLEFDDTMQQVQEDQPGGPIAVNPGHVIGFGLGMIYVANSYDIIPDMVPIIGYVDDAVVLRFSTGIGGALWDKLT